MRPFVVEGGPKFGTVIVYQEPRQAGPSSLHFHEEVFSNASSSERSKGAGRLLKSYPRARRFASVSADTGSDMNTTFVCGETLRRPIPVALPSIPGMTKPTLHDIAASLRQPFCTSEPEISSWGERILLSRRNHGNRVNLAPLR
jgi:hypothetical protein